MHPRHRLSNLPNLPTMSAHQLRPLAQLLPTLAHRQPKSARQPRRIVAAAKCRERCQTDHLEQLCSLRGLARPKLGWLLELPSQKLAVGAASQELAQLRPTLAPMRRQQATRLPCPSLLAPCQQTSPEQPSLVRRRMRPMGLEQQWAGPPWCHTPAKSLALLQPKLEQLQPKTSHREPQNC